MVSQREELRHAKRRAIHQSLRAREVGPEWQRALNEGVPEIGWEGDPWLTVAYNQLEHKFEVWDEKPSATGPTPLAGWPADEGPAAVLKLCALLRDMSIKHRDPLEEIKRIEEHNEKVKQEAEARHAEARSEAAAIIAHAVGKAVGEPGTFFGQVK